MIKRLMEWLKPRLCNHVFDPPDMQIRDEGGLVRWPCYKCGRLFVDTCGLYILHNGRCTGRWSLTKEERDKKKETLTK